MAPVEAHLVLELLLALRLIRVARVGHPAVRGHERRRAEIFVLVPPVAWARGCAACAEDTFVHATEIIFDVHFFFGFRLRVVRLVNVPVKLLAVLL